MVAPNTFTALKPGMACSVAKISAGDGTLTGKVISAIVRASILRLPADNVIVTVDSATPALMANRALILFSTRVMREMFAFSAV